MRFRRCVLVPLVLANAALGQIPTPTPVVAGFTQGRIVYDEGRQRLLFARADGALLEHDGAAWSIAATVPPVGHLVYDPGRRRVVIVASGNVHGYDGHSVAVIGPAPVAVLSRLIVDSGRGRLLGLTIQAGATVLNEFDGVAWTAVAALPGQRIAMGAAYDPRRSRTVLTCLRVTLPLTYETWEWDGSALSGQFTDGVPRGMCEFDATRGRVVTVTGSAMWEWNGAAWANLGGAAPPLGTYSTADLATGRIFTFINSARSVSVWDGSSWSSGPGNPQPGGEGVVTWDAARQRAVRCSSINAGVAPVHAEFDGLDWREMPLPANAPPSLYAHAQIYDPLRAETLVFGGVDATRTTVGSLWALSASGWQQRANGGPAPRANAGIAWDAGRQRVVLVGGLLTDPNSPQYAQDHWEWDGVAWAQVSATTPMGAVGLALGHDARRGRVVAFDDRRRTFEFDGVSWTQVQVQVPGPLWNNPRNLVWDPQAQVLLLSSFDTNLLAVQMGWDGTAWSVSALPFGDVVFDPARAVAYVVDPFGTQAVSSAHAMAVVSGAGCGGAAMPTTLTAFRKPRSGDARFHLDLRADAPLRPAIVGFGVATANVALGSGCSLLVQNPVASAVWFTDAAGFLHLPVPVPANLALRSAVVQAQGAVLDPGSPGGVAMTQRLTLTVGD